MIITFETFEVGRKNQIWGRFKIKITLVLIRLTRKSVHSNNVTPYSLSLHDCSFRGGFDDCVVFINGAHR